MTPNFFGGEMEKPWLKFYDPHVPENLEYPDIFLPRILDDAADQYPDHVAVLFFGAKMKYGELRTLSNQFGHALREIGLRRGDRMGLLLPNMPQTIISAFGALKAGIMVFFFDALMDEEELRRQIDDSGVETVVVLDLVLRRIDPIFSQTRLKNFIITGVKDFLPFPRNFFFSLAARGRGIHVKLAKKPSIYLFKEFIQKGRSDPPGLEGKPLNPKEGAFVLFTRGRSGPAKGVILTHKNVVSNLMQISSWIDSLQKGREIFFSVLPFHQVFGLTLTMNLPIYLAAASIHQPRFDPTQFLNSVKAYQPSIFPAESSMIESLAWNPYLAKYKISSIRTYYSLGASVPEDALQSFEGKTGRRISEGYGVTEASGLTHANPCQGKRKFGSIGIPLPDTDAKILDPRTGETELPVGEKGELIIRGPQVMEGYWKQPEETARVLRGGWLHTGDLARMDGDGFFYIDGKIGKK
jgi:long-chain acyl-CoA synthetase